ncbi:arsenate reductase [Inhella gelatinilytica]|uniref:Arsenate reductase n=1 Tax=Inhella gelatinilytica TaxID=2795030 RepID=A0A931IZL8_9BURK|nr:arsenate reductase [Inhella gelatinilytica]MBH9552878.1 arsenate reductase [Inhella gelatinilytica]
MVVYGIPNCDTVKKARAWLVAAGYAPQFVDFKKQAPTVAQLKAWADQVGWERLLNRAGTTWRKLDEATQGLAHDAAGAIGLMATHSSLIKRPVVDWGGGRLTVGFQPAVYETMAKGG